jgi:hypothetical protein
VDVTPELGTWSEVMLLGGPITFVSGVVPGFVAVFEVESWAGSCCGVSGGVSFSRGAEYWRFCFADFSLVRVPFIGLPEDN